MTRWLLAAGGAALVVLGCEEPQARTFAPPVPRASFVLEPSRIEIGTVATIDLLVVTPPDHAVAAYDAPTEVPGFWILGVAQEPVRKDAGRWLHRTRVRIRSREVGTFEWPEARVRVQAPDAGVGELNAESFPIEVASVLGEFPDQVSPFGARRPDIPEDASGRAGPAAAGALAALLGVAAFAAIRRASRRTRSRPAPRTAAPTAWTAALESISDLRLVADEDPLAAAHGLSATLRRYMARRFGADAEARTTEELSGARPPFAASSRWPAFVALLGDLDAVRFRPTGDAAERRAATERVAASFDAAAAFVEATVPPEARR